MARSLTRAVRTLLAVSRDALHAAAARDQRALAALLRPDSRPPDGAAGSLADSALAHSLWSIFVGPAP